jgi:hypothetical protein
MLILPNYAVEGNLKSTNNAAVAATAVQHATPVIGCQVSKTTVNSLFQVFYSLG